MSPLRLALLAALLALAAGCGRKGDPERPPGAERPDTAATVPMGSRPGGYEPGQDDDPLLERMPAPVTPGPRLEEEIDAELDG